MKLRETILSDQNIYSAIYAVKSYISEPNLLDQNDLMTYHRLMDKFDFNGTVKTVMEECKKTLTSKLDNPQELFEVSVYFKLKKYDEKENEISFRPLHTSSLVNQICMAAMLIPLMFDDTDGTRRYSELSKMLPHNFYGNIPSENVESIFKYWPEQYRLYADIVNEKCIEYRKTREYDDEITFDLVDFFPSVDPSFVADYIVSKLQQRYSDEDIQTLRCVIAKLLYFKITKSNLDGWIDKYYPKTSIKADNDEYINRGIAQGLPQSYFFGNLCMIVVAEIMSRELEDAESFFYVDDSVVFSKHTESPFKDIINKLNNALKEEITGKKFPVDKFVPNELLSIQNQIRYEVRFHDDDKSSICNIEDSFKGLENLFLVQRNVSFGGWINGNVDEVDQKISFKKLNKLEEVVDQEIKRTKDSVKKKGSSTLAETRLKWLKRYRKYFIYRKRKLKTIIEGQFNKSTVDDFYNTFKIDKLLNGDNSNKIKSEIFEILDKDIFDAYLTRLAASMPKEDRKGLCEKVRSFESKLTNSDNNKSNYLYYIKYTRALEVDLPNVDKYGSLLFRMKQIFRYHDMRIFLKTINENHDITANKVWDLLQITTSSKDNVLCLIPEYALFIFHNSEEFKRSILNTCFSLTCNMNVSDSLSLVKTDCKPTKYYELRILSVLRNRRFKSEYFFDFIRKLDCDDINEKMDIDLAILEALNIFRQRVHYPDKIDKLILTHRIVKSLWHNGSKFLNAYTLHNQEHALTLIKNIVRLINNIDFLNLKAYDYFLLFQACYLHDISMVIHPNVASFNETYSDADLLVSKWIIDISKTHQDIKEVINDNKLSSEKVLELRQRIGRKLVEAFHDVFNFFEQKVRSHHPYDSARLIKNWQSSNLSFLTELEAETIATISDSHGWESNDVYYLRSSAKEDLVSIKYMMILIRMADLMDMANDRIDYHILKQNRSQMGLTSRFHWISHLVTDDLKLDVDYDADSEKQLYEKPITENIHLDIFLNADFLATIHINKKCRGFNPSLVLRNPEEPLEDAKEKDKSVKNVKRIKCLEYSPNVDNENCSSSLCRQGDDGKYNCPFLCLWMTKKHNWLFSEVAQLKNYLNSVNSDLIKTNFIVRFYLSGERELDSEFYDDIREYISH